MVSANEQKPFLKRSGGINSLISQSPATGGSNALAAPWHTTSTVESWNPACSSQRRERSFVRVSERSDSRMRRARLLRSPQFHRAVVAARGQGASIRRERQAVDLSGMTGQGEKFLTSQHVPDPDDPA